MNKSLPAPIRVSPSNLDQFKKRELGTITDSASGRIPQGRTVSRRLSVATIRWPALASTSRNAARNSGRLSSADANVATRRNCSKKLGSTGLVSTAEGSVGQSLRSAVSMRRPISCPATVAVIVKASPPDSIRMSGPWAVFRTACRASMGIRAETGVGTGSATVMA